MSKSGESGREVGLLVIEVAGGGCNGGVFEGRGWGDEVMEWIGVTGCQAGKWGKCRMGAEVRVEGVNVG